MLDYGCIKTETSPNGEGSRYAEIYMKVAELLIVNMPNLFAMERVFFNKNVSSAMTTHGAIAIVELATAQIGIDSVLLKPQAVNVAVGFAQADKVKVKETVKRITGASIRNSHAADAVVVAIAGLLKIRDSGYLVT